MAALMRSTSQSRYNSSSACFFCIVHPLSASTSTCRALPETRLVPAVQSKDYDLEGEYIRKWIPELANVPQFYIHEPWKMPPDVAAQVCPCCQQLICSV